MTRDVSDVTHWKRELRFEKSQLVDFCRWKKKVDFRLLTEALWRVRTWFGADGKVSIERWYLSNVENPLNSKVIKSSVPELRSRKCFLCFRIPMLYIYIYMSYEHSVYVSHIHVWLCYILMGMVFIFLSSKTDDLSDWILAKKRERERERERERSRFYLY